MKQYQHHSGETPDVSWRVVRIACEPGFEDIISKIIFESGFSGLEEHTESGSPVYTAYYPVTFQIPAPPENFSNIITGTFDKNIENAGTNPVCG